MRCFSLYPEDELCPNSRALRAGYLLTGVHRPNLEPRIRSHTELVEQHPEDRTSKIGNSPAPGSQIGSRSGVKSTHPPRYEMIFPTLGKRPKRQYITIGPDSSL